ncbi:MAG: nicotinate-nucleotide--dimethylbenzimidazole phosphoribosyltransferase [Holophagales bacterium]|jgi:nicotinate-nucleotide--dimethylbenzimidazole phosphoribosyltransferase|nr:nicotinate-nucleotide--dimethylbenzimidazole phosphoribosyltransferase [Holophagales bacterium]
MSLDALKKYLSRIEPLDIEAKARAEARLISLAKPPGSLGKLEDIAVRLAGISGKMIYDATKRCVIIMASDNGVVEEGVSSAPQSVTCTQTLNFSKGLTGVSAIARQFDADLIVVDVGIAADIDSPFVKNRKIRKSTWNIAKREAMTYDEAVQAIIIGIETAVEAAKDGYALLGAGEMGIGNTTTSAAVLCALTGLSVFLASDKGAGLDSSGHKHKIKVISAALERNRPDPADPIDVLAKVGGFEIAAMAGVFIGGALARVPVVIDGFISIVAALVASRLNLLVKEFMFPSHVSCEQGFGYAASALGVEAPLKLNMRLGEGSGCPIMFAIIDAASAIIRDMGTFEEANIGEEYLKKMHGGDVFFRKNQ